MHNSGCGRVDCRYEEAPLRLIMEHRDIIGRYLSGLGAEVGAFKTPLPGIEPIYIDCFEEYAGTPTLLDYYGSAVAMPFLDSSLNYVAASHVIEHVANPLAALCEWYRICRHRGILYIVVPDRRYTFDRNRALTTVDHMLEDFKSGVDDDDPTHIDDFIFNLDWKLYSPEAAYEDEVKTRNDLRDKYYAAVRARLNINIHFHTFEPASFFQLIQQANAVQAWPGRLRVLEVVSEFPSSNPNGFLIVAQVFKPRRERLKKLFSRKGLMPSARSRGRAKRGQK